MLARLSAYLLLLGLACHFGHAQRSGGTFSILSESTGPLVADGNTSTTGFSQLGATEAMQGTFATTTGFSGTIGFLAQQNSAPMDLNTTVQLTIAENQPIGTIVGEFNATDPDVNSTLTYHLVSGAGDGNNSLFDLNASTGVLSTAAQLDFESDSNLSIRVRVTDEYNATNIGIFEVRVLDNILDETFSLLSSPTWEAGSNFSYSIDVFDDIILVGARYETTNGFSRSGAAYVYRRESNGSIVLLDKLTSPNPGENDQFGGCVKLNNQYAFIGAKHADLNGDDNTGGVFVYKFESNGTISFHTRLGPTSGGNSDQYGWNLDVDDDLILVGALYADANGPNSGEAYLYQQENNGSITLLDTFIGSDTANWDKYGAHVSLYGNHMLIGSYESDPLGPPKSGAIFLNEIEANGTVTELQKITDLPPTQNDRFGERVDLENNLFVVGTPRGDHLGLTDSGYALVGFLESNGTMIRVAKLSSPNLSADNKFGNDVLINGNFISVLSRGENSIHFWEFDRGQKSVSYKGAVSLSGALNKFEGSYKIHDSTLYARVSGYDANGSEHPGKLLVYDLPSKFLPSYVPLSNSNFQTALNLWFSDESNATATYGHISDWNTSAVTDMSRTFRYKSSFNEDISRWDVSAVTDMNGMFFMAGAFNQPIGDWNVSSVTNMQEMFDGAGSFNQPIGNWDLSSVTNIRRMLRYASDFNQPIGNWDVSAVTKMDGMFFMAGAFNQPIGDWNVSSVTNMQEMFDGAGSFNQPIGNWDVKLVTNMHRIFRGTYSFDQDISDWNVSGATTMAEMFVNNNAVSDSNKGLIHQSFSSNSNWPYDWSEFLPNSPPSDLNFAAPLTIAENQPIGTVVGEFNATDPDANATLSYHLVSGAGDGNNSLFTLDVNGTLKTATTFNYETNASTYSIRVQAKDEHNASVEGNFTVTLTDANDPATGTASIIGTPKVGETLTVSNTLTDQDGMGTVSYHWYRDGNPISYGGDLKSGENGVSGMAGSRSSAVSPDGYHVYVSGYSDGTISWFDRDPHSGNLQFVGKVTQGVNGVDGLASVAGIAFSPGGEHVYISSGWGGNALSWYDRNASSGALTWRGVLKDGQGGVDGLNTAGKLVVSPEGTHVYVTAYDDDAVSWYQRDPVSGGLTWLGVAKDGVNGVDGLDGARDLLLSKDGKFLYVSGAADSAIAWFDRNESTGGLAYLGLVRDGANGVDGLGAVTSIASSLNDSTLYASSQHDHSVAWLDRNPDSGDLTFVNIIRNGDQGINSLNVTSSLETSPDGKHLYCTGGRADGNSSVNWFDINSSTGGLTHRNSYLALKNGENLLNGIWNFSLSPDGRNLYASSSLNSTIAWFVRDGILGGLHRGTTGGASHLLSTADQDAAISLQVSYVDGGGYSESLASSPTANIYAIHQPSQSNHFVSSAANLEMIWVEPGTFTMGSPTSEANRDPNETEHNVTLTKGFFLGKYEVTQAQYQAVMTGNGNGLSATPSLYTGNPNHPVEKVSWNDAQIFLSRLNSVEHAAGRLPAGWSYVLPTESQWEYACRAGTVTIYSWGNSIAASNANYDQSGIGNSRQVGKYAANPWGFYDMHGNVSEWIRDWWGGASSGASVSDPTGPSSGSSKIRRGGGFNYPAEALRSAKRMGGAGYSPNDRYLNLGFRVGYQQVNIPPTNLNPLTPLTIAENQPIGTVVGEFNATDPDVNATLTYHLVSGAGDGNNSLFTLETNGTLKTATTFDYESNPLTYAIRVQARDEHNETIEGNFTVILSDVNDDPVISSVLLFIDEPLRTNSMMQLNQFVNDEDNDTGAGPDVLNWSLISGDISYFLLDLNGSLQLISDSDYESSKISYQIGVQVTDGRGGSATANFTIYVNAVDEAPVITSLDGNASVGITVFENQTEVTTVTALDPESGSDVGVSFSIIGGADQSLFSIGASNGNLSFLSAPSSSSPTDVDLDNIYEVIIGVSDGININTQSIAVTVIFTNQTPSDLNSTALLSFAENQPIGTIVGEFNATDPDANATLTYHLVSGAGDGNNTLFTLDVNGTLKTAATFDYESNASTYSIRVQAKDEHNASVEGNFTVTLTDLFEDLDSDGIEDHQDEDVDGDLISNVLETTYGSDLNDPASYPDNLLMDNWYLKREIARGEFSLNSSYGAAQIFYEPASLNGHVRIYLADNYDNKIHVFDEDGSLLFQIELMHVKGVAVSRNSKIYCLFRNGLRAYDYNGNYLHSLGGGGGSADGQFDLNVQVFQDLSQGALAVHPENNWVYALDGDNNRIQVFDENGAYLKQFGSYGSGDGQFTDPKDLCFISDGRLLVGGENGVSYFDKNGIFLKRDVGWLRGARIASGPNRLIWTAGRNSWYGADLGDLHGNIEESDVPGGNRAVFSPEGDLYVVHKSNSSLSHSIRHWKRRTPYPNPNYYPSDLNSTGTLTMAENQPIGTVVGEFNATDSDANATLTYHLVSGAGDGNNSLFSMDANGTLKTATTFNYETNAFTYSIRVQAKDEFNATVEGNFTVILSNEVEDLDGDGIEDFYDSDDDGDGFSDAIELSYGSDPRNASSVANESPTDLNSTAPLTVSENQPIGTFVGEFNATDPDANATLTYHLVSGAGDGNNSLFTLEANGTLRTATTFDYESNASNYSIRVQAKDEHNATVESNFMVSLTNDSSDDVFVPAPITDANFQHAVNLWFIDEANATATYGHIRDWNVSQVTGMAQAFKNRAMFNEDISGWDVSSVKEMHRMFSGASAFNQPIGDWNVSAVIRMDGMFQDASAFNQPIGQWDLASIESVYNMFKEAESFNQPIAGWDLSRVTMTAGMFRGATSFNQPIGTWDISSVNQIFGMFARARSFNQDIGDWDFSSVINMNEMFRDAEAFNQDISGWDLSSVELIASAFNGASSFNQDLSDWNVSSATFMTNLFAGTSSLSNINKGLIHASFSFNPEWPYDWSAFVPAPPTPDGNYTSPDAGHHSPDDSYQTPDMDQGTPDDGYGSPDANYITPDDHFMSPDDGHQSPDDLYGSPDMGEEEPPNQSPVDLNTTAPLFIAENQPQGTEIGEFFAFDPDGDALTFMLVGESNESMDAFTIDSTGSLRSKRSFDFESDPTTFVLFVSAMDPDGAKIEKRFSVTLLNEVEDLDGDGIEDAFDQDIDGDGYSNQEELAYGSDPRDAQSAANASPVFVGPMDFEVAENQPAGVSLGTVQAEDPDGAVAINISLVGDAENRFSLEANGTLLALQSFDYESDPKVFQLSLIVSDDRNASTAGTITVRVVNVIEDLDGDGFEDAFDPDLDGDGLSNADEELFGTNPLLVDTDDDGLTDAEEAELGTKGNKEDSDGDGLADGTEIGIGTNPLLADTDGDGFGDEAEVLAGSFPEDANDYPGKQVVVERDPNEFQGMIYEVSEQTFTLEEAKVYASDQGAEIPFLEEGDPVLPFLGKLLRRELDRKGSARVAGLPDPFLSRSPILTVRSGLRFTSASRKLPVILAREKPEIRLPGVYTQHPEVLGGIVTAKGELMDDGGETPFRIGFRLSEKITVRANDPTARMISASLSGRTFEARIDRLQTGKTYYLRAFAENSAGLLHGSVRKIRLEKEYEAPFDAGAMGQGWHRSDWFGTFQAYDGVQWIFHAEFGWLYHGPTNQNGIWFWKENEGWLWSRKDAWPHLWRHNSGSWLYHFEQQESGALFWDYQSQSYLRW